MRRNSKKSNFDLRLLMIKNNVFQWQVAESLGISEALLSKKLRHELPDEEKERFIAAIKQMTKGE